MPRPRHSPRRDQPGRQPLRAAQDHRDQADTRDRRPTATRTKLPKPRRESLSSLLRPVRHGQSLPHPRLIRRTPGSSTSELTRCPGMMRRARSRRATKPRFAHARQSQPVCESPWHATTCTMQSAAHAAHLTSGQAHGRAAAVRGVRQPETDDVAQQIDSSISSVKAIGRGVAGRRRRAPSTTRTGELDIGSRLADAVSPEAFELRRKPSPLTSRECRAPSRGAGRAGGRKPRRSHPFGVPSSHTTTAQNARLTDAEREPDSRGYRPAHARSGLQQSIAGWA